MGKMLFERYVYTVLSGPLPTNALIETEQICCQRYKRPNRIISIRLLSTGKPVVFQGHSC